MAANSDLLAAEQARMREKMRVQRIEARRQAAQERKEMEASSTTLNINGPEIPAQTQVSLPVGEAIQNLSPTETDTVTVPATLLAELRAQLAELREVKQISGGMSFEQLRFFIEEMKKPDADTAAKIATEKARRKAENDSMIELALLEEQTKREREEGCPHRKENNRTAFVLGHRGDDGNFIYLCQHCQKTVHSKLSPERFGVQTEGRAAFGPGNPLGTYEVQVQ